MWEENEVGQGELATQIAPLLEVIWDDAGEASSDGTNGVRFRAGFDPVEWRVTDPALAEAIAAQATTLARNVQGATEEQVREALKAGIEAGESPSKFRDRIAAAFLIAEKWRAERIARTETIRGYHAAGELSARRSGVVAGWEWLASSDACPVCLEIAARCRYQRLGQAFAVIGSNPDYAPVRYPPAHPHCGCSVSPVLLPEFDGPAQVPWGPTLDQPNGDLSGKVIAPVVKPPEPVEAPKPIPAPAPEPARGAAILPGRPIAERLAAYADGDAKVQAIQQLASADLSAAEAFRSIESEMQAIRARMDEFEAIDRDLTPAELREWTSLGTKIRELQDRRSDAPRAAAREKVLEIIRAKDPIKVEHEEAKEFRGRKFNRLSPEQKQTVDAANRWLSQVLHTDGREGPFKYRVGSIPASNEQRAWQSQGFVAVSKRIPEKTVVHEVGHAIDTLIKDGNPDPDKAGKVIDRSLEYLAHRVGNEPMTSLQKALPGYRYRSDEYGRKDNFDRYFDKNGAYYCGKDYGTRGTEILSMGIEALYHDPVGFATKDPEFCKYVLGILDGSLR